MELGDLDDSGRRRPLPIEGSEFTMEIEMAVIAIGNGTNPLLRDTPGLEFTNRGTLKVDEDTLETTKRGVFAGGDIVTGGATVISAMGAGRKAAQSIHAYLSEQESNQ
jgi:glutamate synthase (NADPH/NADH) small chain